MLAARRGATVTGLDASAGLLDVARERLPEADLREGDLEALPYADDSFDAVTAFNSVQYASDPTAALREIRRVARPGAPRRDHDLGHGPSSARCAPCSAPSARCSRRPRRAPAAPFALAAPGALEALVESAGLTAERAIDVPTPYTHDDLEHRGAGAPRLRPRAPRDRDRRPRGDARRGRCGLRARPVSPDGSVRFDNVFKVLVARA